MSITAPSRSWLAQLAVVLRLELMRWWRSPRMLALAAAPLLMGVFLAVLSLNITHEPVALVVADHGAGCDRLTEILVADTDAYALTVTDAAQAQQLLGNQQVAAVITIPLGFSQDCLRHQGRVELELNNVDIDFADDIRRSLDRSVGAFDGLPIEADTDDVAGQESPAVAPTGPEAAVAATAAQTLNPYHIGIEEHDLRATDVGFLAFELVPILIYLVLNLSLLGAGVLAASERSLGMQAVLAAAPVAPAVLACGRILAAAAVASLAGMLLLGLGVLLRIIPLPVPHLGQVVAVLVATAGVGATWGAALGSLPLQPRTAAMVALLLTTSAILLGGAFCIPAFLPAPLPALCAWDPIHWAVDSLRQGLFYTAVSQPQSALAVLLAAAGLGLVLALSRPWSAASVHVQ